jgi:hypothetical protein
VRVALGYFRLQAPADDTRRAFYFGFQRNGVPFSSLVLKYGNTNVDPAVMAELTNNAQSICPWIPRLVGEQILTNFSRLLQPRLDAMVQPTEHTYPAPVDIPAESSRRTENSELISLPGDDHGVGACLVSSSSYSTFGLIGD